MIKKVNLEEALEIYNFMKKDFPENEIPDYERFFQMTKENIHNVYVYEENKLFNIDFHILVYSITDGKILNKEIKETIENIYNGLFPKENLVINIGEQL